MQLYSLRQVVIIWSSSLHHVVKEQKPTFKILVCHDKIATNNICFTKKKMVLLKCQVKK
jgi:aminoglycoside phosphotransferase family enzyme